MSALEQITGPLQRALEAFLATISGPTESATEMARNLAIEQTLAWRVWRLANATSQKEVIQFAIGRLAMSNFLKAAVAKDASSALADHVRRAHDEFRESVSRIAGDEAALLAMIASAEERKTAPDDAAKRLMFNAYRLRIGAQATSQIRTWILHPSELDGVGSMTLIDAYNDLWWLKPDVKTILQPFFTYNVMRQDKQTGAPGVVLSTPLDPGLTCQAQGPLPQPPLLRAFCSSPMPQVILELAGDSALLIARPAAIGRDKAATLCFGEVRHSHVLPLSEDPFYVNSGHVQIPVEVLVVEIYAHRDWVSNGFVYRPFVRDTLFWPRAAILRGSEIGMASLDATFATIPPTETIDNPVKMPRYPELIDFAFRTLGEQRKDYFCYRLRIPMPPLGLMAGVAAGEDPEKRE